MNACVKCATVNPWEADFLERVNVNEQSTKATAADGHMIFRRAAEADRVTVTSIAIATGEYPAAVITTQLTWMPKP